MSSHSTTRGIDHIGITVPDLEAASRFLVAALGAEIAYTNHTKADPPETGAEAEARLGFVADTAILAVRTLRLGNGPALELFEMRASEQRPAHRANDFGLQHFSIYVDDMAAATARFEAAGGELFSGPNPLTGFEQGAGNAFRYGRTPWGMVMEFMSTPSTMRYEEQAGPRPWKPAADRA